MPACTAWTIVRQEIVRLDAWPLVTASSVSTASHNRYVEIKACRNTATAGNSGAVSASANRQFGKILGAVPGEEESCGAVLVVRNRDRLSLTQSASGTAYRCWLSSTETAEAVPIRQWHLETSFESIAIGTARNEPCLGLCASKILGDKSSVQNPKIHTLCNSKIFEDCKDARQVKNPTRSYTWSSESDFSL